MQSTRCERGNTADGSAESAGLVRLTAWLRRLGWTARLPLRPPAASARRPPASPADQQQQRDRDRADHRRSRHRGGGRLASRPARRARGPPDRAPERVSRRGRSDRRGYRASATPPARGRGRARHWVLGHRLHAARRDGRVPGRVRGRPAVVAGRAVDLGRYRRGDRSVGLPRAHPERARDPSRGGVAGRRVVDGVGPRWVPHATARLRWWVAGRRTRTAGDEGHRVVPCCRVRSGRPAPCGRPSSNRSDAAAQVKTRAAAVSTP